jgi:hypothetical protein
MTKDEAIRKAFLAHDACFNVDASINAFLRSLKDDGLDIIPINPTPEIINAGYKAGGISISSVFRIWRATIQAAQLVTELNPVKQD